MKLFRKVLKSILCVLVLAAFAPSQLFACPACGSGNPNFQSPLADGMNLGILTLFGVIVTVLASIATFFVFIIRKEAALAAKAGSGQNMSEVKA